MAKKQPERSPEEQKVADDASYAMLTIAITSSINLYGSVLLEPLEVCLLGVKRRNPTMLKLWLAKSGTKNVEELAIYIKQGRDTSPDEGQSSS